MATQTPARYRIYCSEAAASALSSDITIEERYPAFVIAAASEASIQEVRKRFPVEPLATAKPPPTVPETANLATLVAEPKRRGPYTVAIRFKAPVRPQWLDAIKKTGCNSHGAIGSSTVVVECPNKPSLKKLRTLEMLERITDYVPTVRLSEGFLAGLAATSVESSIAAIASELAALPKKPIKSSQRLIPGLLNLRFFTKEDRDRALKKLNRQGLQTGVTVGDTGLAVNLANAKDKLQLLQTMVRLPGLRSLSEQARRREFNNAARLVIANQIVTQAPQGLGLSGDGEIVAVADSGLDTGDVLTLHADFGNRVRDIQSFPIVPSLSPLLNNPAGDDGAADTASGHGTHVAGSIVGDGSRAATLGLEPIQGTAPQAELVFQAIEQTTQWNQLGIFQWLIQGQTPPARGLFGIPDDLADLFQPAFDQGARIHSNSWGGGAFGAYNDNSEAIDRFVWDHRDFLVLVAAGNDGEDTNPAGAGIDSGSVTPPGTAKNCLTVGASENNRPEQFTTATYGAWWPTDFPAAPFANDPMTDSIDDIVAFSSRGPCNTGRRKPDVVAPGTFVLSVRSSQIAASHFAWGAFTPAKNDYMYNGGTSMATPLVAGCAALVRQYLRETQSINSPSAALVKGILIHSARYVSYRHARPDATPLADNEQGWGRVDLQQTLNPPAPVQVLFLDQSQGLETGELREFSLDLTDSGPPLRVTLVYTDFPGEDLVNNLNLFVQDPAGNVVVGSDFNGSGVPDAHNNVEGLRIDNPASGQWVIRVVGSNVPEGLQDFALVISGGGLQLV